MKRISFRHLLTGTLLTIWCAALSGFSLEFAPAVLLAAHLATGIGGLVPITLFLRQHWWSRRDWIERHPNTRLGYATVACFIILTLSGLALFPWTNYPPLRWLHNAVSAILLLVLGAHLARRIWLQWMALWRESADRGTVRASHPWPLFHAFLIALVVSGSLIASIWSANALVQPILVQAGTIPLDHASLGTDSLVRAVDCIPCHADLTGQWRVSAHATAADNPYYLALTALFIQERGVDAARFCATCHNPIGLMQGEIDAGAARELSLKTAGNKQAPAYQARALGISLPISLSAEEGVSCALCHQAARAAEQPANGSLRLTNETTSLPTGLFQKLVLRTAPAPHRTALQPAVIQQAELCGACHNLYTPAGMALEPTYDEWLNSPYPEQGRTCQSCHMPSVQARPVGSDLPRSTSSHGGLPGAPSSLPGRAADLTLLRKAATLQIRVDASPGPTGEESITEDQTLVQATVIITNSGAGHALPTGASDLRQMWLEVTLYDAAAQVVWQVGELDDFGALAPEAVQFHKVLGDAGGRPIELHRIWVATQILADTSLAPLERRDIPFAIPIPAQALGPYRLQARLLYRTVPPAFAEFALERPMADLPVFEMATVAVIVQDVR